MRKWSFILFGLTALAGLIVLIGCEGDTGTTGGQGAKGRRGISGVDPDKLPPADRVFAYAVTNATENAISGKSQVFLSFDSTARATRDTVVASKLSVPPLIDGLDGEEPEWGAQKSKMPLSFLNPDPGALDGKLKSGVVRVAYDDDNIYFQFQWQEQPVAGVASVGESKELDELIFSYRKDPDTVRVKKTHCLGKDTYVNSVIYPLVRVTYHPACLFEFTPPDTCECTDLRPTDPSLFGYVAPDTNFLWVKRTGGGEDRLIVFFPDAQTTVGWQDVAFKKFFGFTSIDPTVPSDFFADIWVWGAARTKPVGVADDWSITAVGAQADAGQAPYLENYIASDSLPRYMNRRDPNLRTSETGQSASAAIYPLWYFDATGYTRSGWLEGTSDAPITCSLPGIITMIPSGSRADVYASARFDNGVWTVEMKRARKTHNGDDTRF